MRFVAGFLTLAIAAADFAHAAPVAEQVEIPGGDITLRARLFRPQGSGPFAAVVALHGCGSLFDRAGTLNARFQDWGERLSEAGFAVLFPDSFGSRGLRGQCRSRERAVRASRERLADANAARRWLQQQAWIAPDRVSLMGWSAGAVATLWAVRPAAAPKDGADFRSAVALYPGCRRLRDVAWSARIPTLILIGTADEWTPAAACEQMLSGARGRSAQASIVTYRGAHHDFDHPNLALQERTGLAFTADGSGRAHVGTDPAARADALKRVPEWLAR